MAEQEHRTTVRMPRELNVKARIKALKSNTDLSKVIREFLELWVTGEIVLPSESKEDEDKTD